MMSTTTKHFNYKDPDCLKEDGKRHTMQINTNYKMGGGMIISDKVGFKTKNVSGDKNGNIVYAPVTASIHEAKPDKIREQK